MNPDSSRLGTTLALLAEPEGGSLAERLHLALRFRSAPWDRILGFLPGEEALLDVGCGPGLLAWLLARRGFAGRYLGLDPDTRKVGRARRWALPAGRFAFEEGSAKEAPRGAFSTAAVVDVLYLVPPAERLEFVRDAAGALRPGGRLVVVTSGGGPAWKRSLDRAQERAAVALGVTRGAVVAPFDGAAAADLLVAAGLGDVEVRGIGAGYLHGFEAVLGRVPER